MFAAEVTAIVHEAQPDFLRVVYCDAKVHEEHIFVPDECALEIVLDAKGGGGTAFQPAFDYLANNDCEPPTAALYFTDLEPGDRPKDPGYPVLWVTGLRESRYKPDFGRVVRIDAWGDL